MVAGTSSSKGVFGEANCTGIQIRIKEEGGYGKYW